MPGQFELLIVSKSVSTKVGAEPDPDQEITRNVSPLYAKESYFPYVTSFGVITVTLKTLLATAPVTLSMA
ncbi:Uncharacterised protein [Shigella sonnei]|nr:Uncharacterised protein [Shigella sonnei]